jgi:hypothetical protein
MVTSMERTPDPPPAGAPEEIWKDEGWTLTIDVGKTCALKFPVGSTVIDKSDLKGLPMLEAERCVPAVKVATYRSCSRNFVDKVEADGSITENFYLANAARWAKEGETPNCRLTLDPDNPEECVLISTCKTQSNTEWKLDRDYAHRMLGMGDYEYGQGSLHSDEESETSDVVSTKEVARARRSVTVSEKLDREEEASVYQAQVLSYLEKAGRDQAACLGGLDILRDGQYQTDIKAHEHWEMSYNVSKRTVFDLVRIVSLGKSICNHFQIPLDEVMFPPETDGGETKGSP